MRSLPAASPDARALLAVPPLVAAGIGVFADGGFSAGPRVAFACTGVAAGAIAVATEPEAARRALRDPLAIVLVALALLGALSALWTLAPEGRTLRWGAVTLGYAGVFVGAAVAGRTREGRLVLLAGIGAIAAASAAIGLGAVALHDEPYALRIAGDWRPAGPFQYPPALALLVVSALPAFIAAAWAGRWWLTALGAAGIALATGVLALAASRLGLALGIAVAGVAAYRAIAATRPGPVATRRPFAVTVAVALVALLAGSFAFGATGGFLHGREDTWSAALDTFLDRPLYGAGADAFLAGSARHQDGAAILFAHHMPLELAAELGIAGLLLSLALYAATARVVWDARATRAVWLFGPAVFAFLLFSVVDWPWHLAGAGAIWALGAGALSGRLGNVPRLFPQVEGDP